MKTRTTLLLIASSILFTCQEDIDFNLRNFTKVYGLDGPSNPRTVIETEDGGFIIIGNVSKTPFDENEVISGPFILKTDQNGNELFFRNYSFTQGKLKVLADSAFLDEDITIDYNRFPPSFDDIVALRNGNYFVRGYLRDKNRFFFGFYMILDQDFTPVDFKFLNNSLLEFENGVVIRFFFNGSASQFRPIILDNGDILLLAFSSLNFNWYSIYRLRENGEIISVWNYCPDLSSTCVFDGKHSWHAFGWVLDQKGNIVVSGSQYDNDGIDPFDHDIMVQKINISTGQVVQRAVWGKGEFNLTWGGGVQLSDDGYAILEYHMDTVGIPVPRSGDRNFIGALLFVDENLDSLRHVHITDPEVNRARRFIRTSDGGYIGGFHRFRNALVDFLIVKTDPVGNPLWRYITDPDVYVEDVIETQDGGIVLLLSRDFNFSGNRITLLKLTADGKL